MSTESCFGYTWRFVVVLICIFNLEHVHPVFSGGRTLRLHARGVVRCGHHCGGHPHLPHHRWRSDLQPGGRAHLRARAGNYDDCLFCKHGSCGYMVVVVK